MDDQEKLKFQEIELAERVQERVLRHAKFIVGGFVAGFTILGIVSGSFLVTHISELVTNDVKSDIEQETKLLKFRLADNLAELSVSAKEISKTAKAAKDELEKSREKIARLQDIATQIDAIESQLAKVTETVTKTQITAESAEYKTDKLRDWAVKSTEGKPAVLSIDYRRNGPGGVLSGLTIGGNNFGAQRSTLRIALEFSATSKTAVKEKANFKLSEFILVGEDSIVSWSNIKIEVEFSDDDMKRLEIIIKHTLFEFPHLMQQGVRIKIGS